MIKKSLAIVLGIAATFGVLSLSGCSKDTVSSEDLTTKLETTVSTTIFEETTVSVPETFQEHIVTTVSEPVEQIITEITTPASFQENTVTTVSEPVEQSITEIIESEPIEQSMTETTPTSFDSPEHGDADWEVEAEAWGIEDDSSIIITHSESLTSDYVIKLNIPDCNMYVDGGVTRINSSDLAYACDGVTFNCIETNTGTNIKFTFGNTTYNYDDNITEETTPDDDFPGYDALIYFKELDNAINVTHVEGKLNDNDEYVWDTDDALIANTSNHFKDGVRDKLHDLIIVKCTDKTICCGIAEFDIGFTVFYQIEVDSSVSDADLLETFSTLISSLEVSTRPRG